MFIQLIPNFLSNFIAITKAIEDVNENEIFEIESFPGETILLQIDRTVELNFPQMDLRTKGTLVITNLRLAFVYGNEVSITNDLTKI